MTDKLRCFLTKHLSPMYPDECVSYGIIDDVIDNIQYLINDYNAGNYIYSPLDLVDILADCLLIDKDTLCQLFNEADIKYSDIVSFDS